MTKRLLSAVVASAFLKRPVGRKVALVSTALLAGLATAVAAVAAPGSWTQPSPTASPPARYFASMATDTNGNVVLFGGNGATSGLSDTWLWNGADWSQPTLTTGPSGRAGAPAASDTNGTVVLFGGINASTLQFKNDTWLWNGSSWTQASPSTSPPARWGAGMATDTNGHVVLFGGQSPSFSNLNDTWLWDGSSWTEAFPTTSPPARVAVSLATDTNGKVVLFGGQSPSFSNLNDTWLWDGSNWSQPSLATSPPPRAGPAMAADGNGGVVLFGGVGSTLFADTWLWDGSSWTEASPSTSPLARVNAGIAKDKSGKMVLFGGFRFGPGAPPFGALNDTWLFSPSLDTTPPVITVPGSQSVPATSPAGATVTFQVSATDAVDGPVPATCTPPSGSVFPIGDTLVECNAEDAAGNMATASFTVHVKGAPEQVADLIALVDSYNLLLLGTALHDKLVKVQEFLAANKPRRACEVLDRFLAQVKEQRGKRISVEQADRLTADARRIKSVIGC